MISLSDFLYFDLFRYTYSQHLAIYFKSKMLAAALMICVESNSCFSAIRFVIHGMFIMIFIYMMKVKP